MAAISGLGQPRLTARLTLVLASLLTTEAMKFQRSDTLATTPIMIASSDLVLAMARTSGISLVERSPSTVYSQFQPNLSAAPRLALVLLRTMLSEFSLMIPLAIELAWISRTRGTAFSGQHS